MVHVNVGGGGVQLLSRVPFFATPWKSLPGFSVHLKQNVLEYS